MGFAFEDVLNVSISVSGYACLGFEICVDQGSIFFLISELLHFSLPYGSVF